MMGWSLDWTWAVVEDLDGWKPGDVVEVGISGDGVVCEVDGYVGEYVDSIGDFFYVGRAFDTRETVIYDALSNAQRKHQDEIAHVLEQTISDILESQHRGEV